MKNPFKYGVPVTGEYYLPRPFLIKKLTPYAISGQKVLLYGPRRFGKTSFLQEFATHLTKYSIHSIIIDLYPITSHSDFLHALTKAIKPYNIRSFMQFFKDTFSAIFRIRPKINLEPTHVSLDFSIDSMNSDDIKTAIEDTMRMLGEFHKKQKLMVLFDEFQKIAEISDNGWLEGTLRSEIQKQQDVPYLFCGSRRGLILDMFQNTQRPFYHMAIPIEFPRFNDEFIDWLKKRFTKAHLSISKSVIKYILDITDWSPNYAQMIAFHLIANHSHKEVIDKTIDSTLNEICTLNTYTYMTLFDSLSSNAQRLLRLAALNPGESPFKQELLQKFQLTNSTVQAALKSLINKRILDDSTSKGKLYFDDPLFLRWIQNAFRY